MTLPVTLADTPALPRAAEAVASAVAGVAGEGGTGFAETLSDALAATPVGSAVPTAVAPLATEAPAPDAEAMLADLEPRVAGLGGAVAVPPDGPPDGPLDGPLAGLTDVAVPAPEAVMGDDALTPVPDSGEGDGEGGSTVEAPAEEAPAEKALAEEVPLVALLAAAMPMAQAAEGSAPPVPSAAAAVEAARRAMAATMTVPGLVKAAKGPLDGPEAPEPAAEGEAMVADGEEIAPARTAAAGEARPAALPPVLPATEPRQGAEARHEAVADIVLATTGDGGAEPGAGPAATATALPQGGGPVLPPVPGGPIQTGRPGWEAALADRIAAELSPDGKEIALELAPERLGHLKIRLEVVDGLAQVRIVTETPEAARLFQQAEHRLSESLSRAGLGLGGQDAASRDAQSGGTQGQAGQGQAGPGDRGGRPRGMEMHFDRQGHAALTERAGRAGRGLVNLIA